jgi:hypothetical protein
VKLVKPSTPDNYRSLALFCAIGSIWTLCNFYQALQSVPIPHGTDPLLQGYRTQGYSDYSFKLRELITFYGFTDAPTPSFVIYSRIALRCCFWTVAGIILWIYSSRLERINNGFRLIGTLGVGLVIIDEFVRLQVRGEAYRHLYLINSFGTWSKTLGTLFIFVLILLLLTPWPQFLLRIRKIKKGDGVERPKKGGPVRSQGA